MKKYNYERPTLNTVGLQVFNVIVNKGHELSFSAFVTTLGSWPTTKARATPTENRTFSTTLHNTLSTMVIEQRKYSAE
uniref:Uncharacterized protein n=1 Tax=Pararge aegeria TaxID=116150 RepID=S4PB39_9NEOP